MADDEIARLSELRTIKRNRLRILERQIAQFGEQYAPAHLLTERAELHETLAKYETVLGSAIPSDVGDDLGASGRFVLTMEEFRSLRDMIALYGYQLGGFIEETNTYRAAHAKEHTRDRKWQIAVAVGVFLLLAFVLGRLI